MVFIVFLIYYNIVKGSICVSELHIRFCRYIFVLLKQNKLYNYE